MSVVGVDDIKLYGVNLTYGKTSPVSGHAPATVPLSKQATTTSPLSKQATTTSPLSKQATTPAHIHSTSAIGTTTYSSSAGSITSETLSTVSATSTNIKHNSQIKRSTQNVMKLTSTKMSPISITSSSDSGSTATSLTDNSTSSIYVATSPPRSNTSEFGTSKSPTSVDVTTIPATTKEALATQSRTSPKAKGGNKTTTKDKPKKTENRKKDKQTEGNNYRMTSTIVGCAVGAVFALVLIVVVVYFIAHNKIRAKQKRIQGAVGPEKQDGAPQTAHTHGTYLSYTAEQITSDDHHRHVYDNFTAYSLNEMNLRSKDDSTHVNIANRESLPDNTKHVSIANTEVCYNGHIATAGGEEYVTRL